MHRNSGNSHKGEVSKLLPTIKLTDSEREELLDVIEGKLLIAVANKFLEEGMKREFLIQHEYHEKEKKYRHWTETHKALKIRTEQSLQ